MRAYRFSEFIDRPPDRVWEVFTDLSVAPRWRPMIVSMETVDGQPLRLGSEVRIVAELFGRRHERVSKTTAFEPARRWELHSSDSKEIEGSFDFRLEPEGKGTRMTATCHLEAHTFMIWLFMPLIAVGERSRRVEILKNLKRLVEGRVQPGNGF